MQFTDCMIDTETLGQRAGCAVLSIGAVAFDHDKGVLGESFYVILNTRSCCERYGLHKDESTMKWWRGQSDEARKVLAEAEESKVGLADGLTQLTAFFKAFDPWKVRVWSNGADFDLPILAHCYAKVERETPWKFWNSRCFRTLKYLSGDPKKRAVAHNALTDAADQAKEAMEILARINGKK